jgi:hypothetical protein
MVGVDKIKADRQMADSRLTRSGHGQFHRFPGKDFRAAGLVNAYGVGHNYLLKFFVIFPPNPERIIWQ